MFEVKKPNDTATNIIIRSVAAIKPEEACQQKMPVYHTHDNYLSYAELLDQNCATETFVADTITNEVEPEIANQINTTLIQKHI